MDRLGGFAVIVSLYSFWTALIGDKANFLGYTRAEMLTYVLALNILRSFVFTGRGWQLVGEISSGRISSYLIRPLSYYGYALALDMAQKQSMSRRPCSRSSSRPLRPRKSVSAERPRDLDFIRRRGDIVVPAFLFLEFMISSLAFWTSESGAPCSASSCSFSSRPGAFFPLDVLPTALRRALEATPFPYMVYFPVRVFLEKVSAAEALRLLGMEALWLLVVFTSAMTVWKSGVRSYAAEGG